MVVPCQKQSVFRRQLGPSRFSRQRPFGLMLTSQMMRRGFAQCWINWYRDADLPLGGDGLLLGCFEGCHPMLLTMAPNQRFQGTRGAAESLCQRLLRAPLNRIPLCGSNL